MADKLYSTHHCLECIDVRTNANRADIHRNKPNTQNHHQETRATPYKSDIAKVHMDKGFVFF